MRNNSQSPGCIRALPASQSCHVRRAEKMRAAAAVCESPANSRARRMSDGAGLVICPAVAVNKVFFAMIFVSLNERVDRLTEGILIDMQERPIVLLFVQMIAFLTVVPFLNSAHDLLRLFGLRCATHELNYTRIPCNSKKYFMENAEAGISPHNAK